MIESPWSIHYDFYSIPYMSVFMLETAWYVMR